MWSNIGRMCRRPVVTVGKSDDLVAEMRAIGVRRMPVVDAEGLLVGVVSLDDILETLAEELGNVAGSIRHGQRMESTLRT